MNEPTQPFPFFDVVFDDPPGPISGRFVEIEDAQGASLKLGEWIQRPDGLHALRYTRADVEAYFTNNRLHSSLTFALGVLTQLIHGEMSRGAPIPKEKVELLEDIVAGLAEQIPELTHPIALELIEKRNARRDARKDSGR